MTLYEINEQYRQALDAVTVDEETGEIIGEEALEDLGDSAEEKWEAYAIVIKELRNDAFCIKQEMDNLKKRYEAINKKAEYLKTALDNSMRLLDKDSLKTCRASITYRLSTSVNVIDQDALPKRFVRTKKIVEPDKTAIADALKNGFKVKGAELVTKRNIQIK